VLSSNPKLIDPAKRRDGGEQLRQIIFGQSVLKQQLDAVLSHAGRAPRAAGRLPCRQPVSSERALALVAGRVDPRNAEWRPEP